MFDQSFSHQNLFKIYVSENKKGNNLAEKYFGDVDFEYTKINRVRTLIRRAYSRRRNYSKEVFETRILLLYRILHGLKSRKNDLVREHLKRISKNVSKKDFHFVIKKGANKVNGKDVYISNGSSSSFFSEKQIQRNIKYIYGVKQADRDLIIPQLKSVLDDQFPKIIIKTDIKSFYESIDREMLLKKLNESPLLSLTTRKLIARLLKSYEKASGSKSGIPRGVGVSAYLSELYMKRFDTVIESLPNLIYYSRYVDDIVIVLTKEPGHKAEHYLKLVEDQLHKEKLKINTVGGKTKVTVVEGASTPFSFDYLGYKFKYASGRITLELAQKKILKYESRIKAVIDTYNKHCIKQPNKSKKELFLRLKFLTSNTKLSNNKGNAVVGIYNSNKWISDPTYLSALDRKLMGISRKIKNPNVRKKISKFSFQKGFEDRTFSGFSPSDFFTITKVWS
ncbi:RNA-directed DNA polymerase [Pseudoalteromonas sp. BZK2]|uniref:antiviral reverse transcriptase Drt3a n=1 Tax=Pseudoalteromonas sp. BZK2 TaxID=1904458 RepID=UPI0016549622|nr:antiviral reverse transcriptase Drt3a [Pseudoalteromonas sp. BZK2]MBC7009901.1 RNA-directed DNA polymerase [Pseudoalteromonas sp. BZK2]